MRIFVGLLIAGLLPLAPQPLEMIPALTISGANDQGAAVAKTKAGQVRWKNSWTMEKTYLEGKPVIQFTENGEGFHSPFTQEEVRWTITSWWTNDGALLPLRSESIFTDAKGAGLSKETRSFDWARKQARIERMDSKTQKASSQTLTIPADTLGVDGIARILQGLDFSRTAPFTAHLLTNEPKVYDISIEIRGREKIQIRDGVVECFKVELVPHVGILNAFRFLYPKTYFWFRVDSPHIWTRYEGLENGPGSPEIVMEMR